MIRFIEANALKALWTITILNLGGGSLVWLLSAFRGSWAQIDPLDDLSRSEREDILQSAMSWQLLAVPTIEFGILVLVVTLAVAAIVSSAQGTSGSDTQVRTSSQTGVGESEKALARAFNSLMEKKSGIEKRNAPLPRPNRVRKPRTAMREFIWQAFLALLGLTVLLFIVYVVGQ